jgi:O-antigen ligase
MPFVVYVILAWGFGMFGQFSESLGKNATGSHRTVIWQVLLMVPINSVLGAGYQSFWVDGSRVAWVWARLDGDNVIGSHNGYLETYLNLGLVGLSLLCMFLITTYRKLCTQLESVTPLGTLGMGLWSLSLFYNVTEAQFQLGLLFVTLLMGTLAVPPGATARVHASASRGRTIPNTRLQPLSRKWAPGS